ncbi:MAG: hypothetical protein H7328_10410 [Bdellovibrio sp.]|nr:hypothetical protein [Bdellovibrio sp.]
MIDAQMIKHASAETAKVMNISDQCSAILINSETQKIDEIQPWLDSQNIKALS